MKKITLFILFLTTVSMLELNSCKKDETDAADKFVGTWVNIDDASDIVTFTKVNANTILANGEDQLLVSGSSFTGSFIDDSNNHTMTVSGTLNGSIIYVIMNEKDQQGNQIGTYNLQYKKA